jgi:hypothetical protein
MDNVNFEKAILTEEDFEDMNWHDCNIHAISFGINYELSFDIDYIFKWIEPRAETKNYEFLVAPCTLIFENVHELKLDLEIAEPFKLEIESIIKHNPQRPINVDYIKSEVEYRWKIEAQQGNITFISVGYKQFVRQNPRVSNSQSFNLIERGGISFGKLISKL